MKRIIFTFGFCLLLLAGFIASEEELTNVTAPVEINAITDTFMVDPDGRTEWIAEYKRLTGITLNVTQPPHSEYSTKLGLLFAGGEVPDLIEMMAGDYPQYSGQGLLVPLDGFIDQSAAMKSFKQDILEMYRMPDGKIYGFPKDAGGGCVIYIRKDWLNRLGLREPTTWDEFYAVLKAFTNNDPDGNRVNDTFGYTISLNVPVSEFDYYNRAFMLDARFDFTKKNGRWVDGFTEPEMVGALQRFRKCYQEGLIDSEYVSNATSNTRQKFTDGKAGVMEYWSGAWAVRLINGAKAKNLDAQIISIPPIKGARYLARGGVCWAIPKGAKNPAGIFKYWMEFSVDKGAGQMLFTYGVKGFHYDEVNGRLVTLATHSNPKERYKKGIIEPAFTPNDWQLPIQDEPSNVISREIHVKYSDPLLIIPGGDLFGQFAGEIWKTKQINFTKIIKGELSIEEGLKQYKDRARSLNLDGILVELNTK